MINRGRYEEGDLSIKEIANYKTGKVEAIQGLFVHT